MQPMRILVHDYSGHPFQMQLSRQLAAMGHRVDHLYSADFQTPKGDLAPRAGDPASLTITALTLGRPFVKDSFVRRRFQEQAFGRLVAAAITARRPDVVISSNAPLDAQRQIEAAARASGAAFVFWLQDLYGVAIARVLRGKFGPVGAAIGGWYRRIEHRLLRESDAVVAISDGFVAEVRAAGVDPARLHIVENWAPLHDIGYRPPRPDGGRPARFVYTGTLGYKHNPDVLADLARVPGVEVCVYSEGAAADGLRRRAGAPGLERLSVRPWVPFSELSDVLADSDVLLAMLEPDAGTYSVPSKVLTYLAAGRPILAAVPAENLAAAIIARERAGFVRPPGDGAGLAADAAKLASDAGLREALGTSGRAYALRAFDIKHLGARFEQIARDALARRRPTR